MKRAFINPEPRGDLPPDAPRDAVKIEFAKRLQHYMVKKGWNQSELARAADREIKRIDKTKRFGRDNVSVYMRAKSLPGPIQLAALAKVLNVKVEELLPQRGVPTASDRAPPFDMRSLEDGNVWLRVNQSISMKSAMKIMAVINEENQ